MFPDLGISPATYTGMRVTSHTLVITPSSLANRIARLAIAYARTSIDSIQTSRTVASGPVPVGDGTGLSARDRARIRRLVALSREFMSACREGASSEILDAISAEIAQVQGGHIG